MSAIAEPQGESSRNEPEAVAHIASPLIYVAVFLGLLLLTAGTVGQSYLDLGKLNFVLVMGIATLKALLILGFFMHLKWDTKFHAVVVVTALFFLGVFCTYTHADTNRRGEFDPDQGGVLDPEKAVRVLPKTGEPAPGGFGASE
jgi:cytochrome c oxidase subunit 4